MSLRIVGIFDRGKPNIERVEFEAMAPLDLSFYIAMHTTTVGDGVANGSHPAFWFPTLSLVAGERFGLFTGSLLNPANVSRAGRSFFWGLKQTIFNTPADRLVLIQAANWRTSEVDPIKSTPLGDLAAAALYPPAKPL